MASVHQLIPLTAVIAVRLDCPERLDNLWTTTGYLLDHLLVEQVIVVEADVRPKLLGTIDHQRLRWQYIQVSPSWPWNRARVMNAALPFVNTRYLALWDADCLVSPEAVHTAIDSLTTSPFIIPFDRVLYMKPDAPLRNIVQSGKWETPRMDWATAVADTPTGGISITTAGFFRHIRGFSELFHGYGHEENELVMRIAKLGHPIIKVSGDGAHLYHPRTTSVFNPEFNDLSMAEVQRTMDGTPEQLRAYLGITEHAGRYVSLRRPDPPSVRRPTTA